VVSLMAFMESIMRVASSGPKIASIMEGSRVDEGAVGGSVDVVVVEEFKAAHSKSCFARLSMLMKMIGGEVNNLLQRVKRKPDSLSITST
jgi:hypothetical protein